MHRLTPLAAALTVATLATPFTANGQAIEEVIVTAQKQAQSLQDVPVAVTAFTSDIIQEAGINDAGDLAIMTPSLTANSNTNPFTTRMQIRGIGTSQTDPALEPSVGLFVDGIFMGRTGLGTADLADIERIEVLQGPQGTLYGKNTNAGAISVITKRPNMEEFEGYVDATVGNYGMGRLSVTASGPVSDSVAYRVSGNLLQRDGYYDNPSQPDQNDASDWNLQGKLLWDPTDRLSILFSAAHVDRDSTCCGADAVQSDAVNQALVNQGFAADANDPYDYRVATSTPESFTMESDLVSLHIDYDVDWGTLTSITAWNDYEYLTALDPDRSQLDILSVPGEANSGDSFSQELRLAASIGDNLDYQLGFFYFDQSTTRGDRSPTAVIGTDFVAIADQQGLPIPVPTLGLIAQPGDYLSYENTWENETVAFFGQATWHLADSWHLTGGLRYSDEERVATLFSETVSTAPLAALFSFLDTVSTPIDATLDRSSDNVDWLLKLAYDLGDDSMVYASAGTGTKSGNFNGVSGDPELREFEDEETISYELGVKTTLLDSRLRINAAAFYTEVTDLQAQEQLPTGVGTFVSNTGEVEVSGLDVQVEAVPLPNLTLTGGLLYLNDYDYTDGPRADTRLPFTAEISGNLGATLVFPLADGGIFLRADYIFMGDHFTNAANAAVLADKDTDDREVFNARIGWRNDHWNVSLWGKNLTDDEYVAQTVNTFAISGMDAYFLATPRTYGATLRYDF